MASSLDTGSAAGPEGTAASESRAERLPSRDLAIAVAVAVTVGLLTGSTVATVRAVTAGRVLVADPLALAAVVVGTLGVATLAIGPAAQYSYATVYGPAAAGRTIWSDVQYVAILVVTFSGIATAALGVEVGLGLSPVETAATAPIVGVYVATVGSALALGLGARRGPLPVPGVLRVQTWGPPADVSLALAVTGATARLLFPAAGTATGPAIVGAVAVGICAAMARRRGVFDPRVSAAAASVSLSARVPLRDWAAVGTGLTVGSSLLFCHEFGLVSVEHLPWIPGELRFLVVALPALTGLVTGILAGPRLDDGVWHAVGSATALSVLPAIWWTTEELLAGSEDVWLMGSHGADVEPLDGPLEFGVGLFVAAFSAIPFFALAAALFGGLGGLVGALAVEQIQGRSAGVGERDGHP